MIYSIAKTQVTSPPRIGGPADFEAEPGGVYNGDGNCWKKGHDH